MEIIKLTFFFTRLLIYKTIWTTFATLTGVCRNVFSCNFFSIYHQARIYKTRSALTATVTAKKSIWCLVFVRVAAFVRPRLFCMLETRRQCWPLGDRRSNKDVWLLQNPSAGIFLLSFTPSLGSQHTSSYFLKNTQAHTVTLFYPLRPLL